MHWLCWKIEFLNTEIQQNTEMDLPVLGKKITLQFLRLSPNTVLPTPIWGNLD